MKTHVFIFSTKFPRGHCDQGEPTGFPHLILCGDKITSIRGNYEFWKHRIDEFRTGFAEISFRYWTETPYRSKQHEFMRANRHTHRMICSKIIKHGNDFTLSAINQSLSIGYLSKTEGLTEKQLLSWFKKYKDGEYAYIRFEKLPF